MPVSVARRGSGKHNQSTIGQFLNPANGVREQMIAKGIQPRNHMRDNMKEIKYRQVITYVFFIFAIKISTKENF